MSSNDATPRVYIVATGVANTASVCAAFRRLACATQIVTTPAEISAAEFLVLPGVGAFAAAMTRLRSADQVDALRQRVTDDRPTLAICLGMQLLGTGSEEAPFETGLGLVSAVATRFDAQQRVPHMGWNRVVADQTCAMLTTGDAYFANSYRWTAADGGAPVDGSSAGGLSADGWSAGRAAHGGSFLAAVERGNVLACQFHPELSGDYGAALLRRWLRQGGAA